MDFKKDAGAVQLKSSEGRMENDDQLTSSKYMFASLKKDYGTVLEALQNTVGAERYAGDFIRFWQAFENSYANEQRLTKQLEELRDNYAALSTKASEAIARNEYDQDIIKTLRADKESALEIVDATRDRELEAHDLIDSLRQRNNKLNLQIRMKAKLSFDLDAEFNSLKVENETLTNDLASVKQELERMIRVQNILETKNNKANTTIFALKLKNKELQDRNAAMVLDAELFGSYKEDLEKTKIELNKRNSEVAQHLLELKLAKEAATVTENRLEECRESCKLLNTNNTTLSERYAELQDEYSLQATHVKLQAQKINTLSELNKSKEDEISRLRNDIEKFVKEQGMNTRRVQIAEITRSKAVEDRDKIRNAYGIMTKEMGSLKQSLESSKREVVDYKRAVENANKAVTRAAAAAIEESRITKAKDKARRYLEGKLEMQIKELQRLKTQVDALQKEKDRHVQELRLLAARVEEGLEESRLQKAEIYDSKKQLVEAETRFRQLQNVLDSVSKDRKKISKDLLQARDEVDDLKQKIKALTHQLKEVRTDNAAKENQLATDKFALRKMRGEKKVLNANLMKSQEEILGHKHYIDKLEKNKTELEALLQQVQKDREKKNKEFELLANERDILGTQLVRRNDELKVLHEKADTLKILLDNGVTEYNQRLEDIRRLKLDMNKLQSDNGKLVRNVSNIGEMRQERDNLEKDLAEQSLKVRALEEEMSNPLNIHRWRKSKGSDPATHQLLQKIVVLQRMVKKASNEAVDKGNKLKETEKLFNELKEKLAKQPGQDINLRLQETQRALKEKDCKLKSLIVELGMCESEMSEKQQDRDCAMQQLVTMKAEFYKQKLCADKMKQTIADAAKTTTSLPVVSLIKSQTSGSRGKNLLPKLSSVKSQTSDRRPTLLDPTMPTPTPVPSLPIISVTNLNLSLPVLSVTNLTFDPS